MPEQNEDFKVVYHKRPGKCGREISRGGQEEEGEMQKNINEKMLKRELKDKLDWYTMYASEKEYDEKAVESILYLLDHIDPLEEGSAPPPEEAWERFLKRKEKARELLPLNGEEAAALREEIRRLGKNESSIAGRNESKVLASGGESAVASNAAGDSRTETTGDSRLDGKPAGEKRKDSALPGKKGKIAGFMLCYKAAAAVFLLVTAVVVGGSFQAGAVKNDGFFFWLKQDETGTEMITSPEMLEGETNVVDETIYLDRKDMPEWTQEWLKIEEEFEMPVNYEWQYYETKQFEFIKSVIGYYFDKNTEQEIVLGIHIYDENIFYNRDRYANYDYIDTYEVDQKQMDIYNKMETTGEVFYTICFYEGNCRYSIRGQNGLEELKELANHYWYCVKNNL